MSIEIVSHFYIYINIDTSKEFPIDLSRGIKICMQIFLNGKIIKL